jgi:5-methylcytosine-specific restriction endonuclease McrA
VLVLNKYYAAINVVSARRAFVLLFKDSAEVVACQEDKVATYDLRGWLVLSRLKSASTDGDEDWVRTPSMRVCVPRIVRLLTYNRVPEKTVRFNRRNIIARDENRCQYCGRSFPSKRLTLDHVVPRSLGGQTTWGNVVCACGECNVRKGGRPPDDAGMELVRRPGKPKRSPVISFRIRERKYQSWKHFVHDSAGEATR